MAVFCCVYTSQLIAQDVSVSIQEVLTSNSGDADIEDGEVKVKIYVSTTIPIHSYSFTLEGFGPEHIIHETEENPYDLLESSGAFNFQNHILDNYFYGGSIDGTMIQPQNDVLFLSFIASYDELNAGNYLTFDEIIPGANDQGTSFFTSNGDGDFVEIPQENIQWIKTTWVIGEDSIHDYSGEDCLGEILGLAVWDDCGTCTGGSTEDENGDPFEYNYQLDCMGVCSGGAEIHDYWYDYDGDGFGTGISQEFCDAEVSDSGWVLNGDDLDDNCFTENQDGVHYYDCSGICNGEAFLDECEVCSGGDTGHIANSDQDCSGECFGDSVQQNWYEDCDQDGQADDQTYIEVCGYPMDSIIEELCGESGNMIAIDPNNHTFDPHPDCTSNYVDECGTCDGPGRDCRETCHPNSPLSVSNYCWNISSESGWGIDLSMVIESATGQDTTITFIEGCRDFIGYESNFEYSHDNGIDLCGECYLGDIIGNDDYEKNYSCTGCMDENAANFDFEADFPSYECFFQLYPGDVNQDGIVNALDIDGIAIFWNYFTDDELSGRINPTIDWIPQFAYEGNWYDSNGLQADPSCPMFADTNGDSVVDSGDITAILNNWGNEVDPNYYYPWGYNGNGPNCLDAFYDEDQLRQNYTDIYNYITSDCPCDLEDQEIINYLSDLLGIDDSVEYLPNDFKVYQNFPNPFNPVTQFPIDVDIQSDVTLQIYNLQGSVVYEYSVKSMEPGSYHLNSPFKWNAAEFSSGVYFYSFKSSAGEIHYSKLMLIK